MIFSHPKMEFTKLPNGWRVSIDLYPLRAHYIKLEGGHQTNWMLQDVECIREDMSEYIDLMMHWYRQEGILDETVGQPLAGY
jgi:hypothetical protein